MATTTGTQRHRALLYEDGQQLVDAVAPFVRAGIAAGERAVVALMPGPLAWLREALGADADAAELADAGAVYARHGPLLSSLLEELAVGAQRPIRIVAEQAPAARTAPEARAYMRCEAAANVAYWPFAASVLCPYDMRRLPDATLRQAEETHPHVLNGDAGHPSATFMDPREFVRRHSRVEPPPARAVELALARVDDLAPIRHRIARLAEAAGLPQARIEALAVAATELAANALAHGAPPHHAWVYADGDAFVCHVHDSGSGLDDPLAGYLIPGLTGSGGRGLWLANHLCDTVEAGTDASGTHVRVRMRR